MTVRNLPRQPLRFHLPLEPADTEDTTLGCRHTNPDICGKHSLATVCAFVRGDGTCLAPPSTWRRQFRKLLGEAVAK
jgi:hypothetical protein